MKFDCKIKHCGRSKWNRETRIAAEHYWYYLTIKKEWQKIESAVWLACTCMCAKSCHIHLPTIIVRIVVSWLHCVLCQETSRNQFNLNTSMYKMKLHQSLTPRVVPFLLSPSSETQKKPARKNKLRTILEARSTPPGSHVAYFSHLARRTKWKREYS